MVAGRRNGLSHHILIHKQEAKNTHIHQEQTFRNLSDVSE